MRYRFTTLIDEKFDERIRTSLNNTSNIQMSIEFSDAKTQDSQAKAGSIVADREGKTGTLREIELSKLEPEPLDVSGRLLYYF